MAREQQRATWEIRIGLGLIGGLLAVLMYVAWQRIDAILSKPAMRLDEAQATATAVRPKTTRATGAEPTILPSRRGDMPEQSPAPVSTPAYDSAPPRRAIVTEPSADALAPDDIVEIAAEAPANDQPPSPAFIEGNEEAGAEGQAAFVVTEDDDSFWSIAERAYGDGAWFKALYAHNRDRFPVPDSVPAGELVDTPPTDELKRLYPELCPAVEAVTANFEADDEPLAGQAPRIDVALASHETPWAGRTYVVQDGQTLAEIAELTLGQRSRWTEIYRLNRDRLGDQFESPPAGAVLVLPETARIADSYEPAPSGERR